MKTSSRRLLAIATFAAMASCSGHSAPAPPSGYGGNDQTTVRDYRNTSPSLRVTPQSVCLWNGNKWICGGSSGNNGPCPITSLTTALAPPPQTRTTIGVGEQAIITTEGRNLQAFGDGTLDSNTSPATLTAGSTGGTIVVSVNALGRQCSANHLNFTVLAPIATLYERADNSVYHRQGLAEIGVLSNVYLAPDSVSFSNLYWQEALAFSSATGIWGVCNNNQPVYPGPPAPAGPNVSPGYGTQVLTYDQAETGACAGNQLQASTETVHIPTLYSYLIPGGWSPINTVLHSGTAAASGALTFAKDHSTGNSTVNSPSSGW